MKENCPKVVDIFSYLQNSTILTWCKKNDFVKKRGVPIYSGDRVTFCDPAIVSISLKKYKSRVRTQPWEGKWD